MDMIGDEPKDPAGIPNIGKWAGEQGHTYFAYYGAAAGAVKPTGRNAIEVFG
ncbi:MAG: hypothetical protein K4571_15660 [Deltaproteobacteria bacterium]